MYIEVDLAVMPPQITLREPDRFDSFKVVVIPADHAAVPTSTVRHLAGDRAMAPDWNAALDEMVRQAARYGWVTDDGAIRAHIETAVSA